MTDTEQPEPARPLGLVPEEKPKKRKRAKPKAKPKPAVQPGSVQRSETIE